MFDMFTERARRVVVLAEEVAQERRNESVGVRHLLLGLLREGEGIAARALTSLGWTEEKIGMALWAERRKTAPLTKLSLTPNAQAVLELARCDAIAMHYNYVGTEHILLAITGRRGELSEGVFTQEEAVSIRDAAMRLMAGPSPEAIAMDKRLEFDSLTVGDLLKMWSIMSRLHDQMVIREPYPRQEAIQKARQIATRIANIKDTDLEALNAKELSALLRFLRKMQTSAEEAAD